MADEPETAAACRFCGKPYPGEGAPPADWQCAKCGRWQDVTVCPTCHSVVRLSLLPEDAKTAALDRERAGPPKK